LFAEIYKNYEKGKYPVKFLRPDPYDKVKRVYLYQNHEIICEAYNGASNVNSCYM